MRAQDIKSGSFIIKDVNGITLFQVNVFGAIRGSTRGGEVGRESPEEHGAALWLPLQSNVICGSYGNRRAVCAHGRVKRWIRVAVSPFACQAFTRVLFLNS